MNILITSAHYHLSDKYGSEAKWGIEIINNYAQLGHKVFVISGTQEMTKPFTKGVKSYRMSKFRSANPFVEVIKKAFYPFYSYYWSRKIYKKLRGDVDIVHHIAPASTVSYDLFFIFRPKNAKARFLWGPAMMSGKESGYKSMALMLGTENYFAVMLIYPFIKISLFFLRKISKITFKRADIIAVVTNETKKFYSKVILPFKIKVIHVGINADKFKLTKRKNVKEVTILSVSNLIQRKGIDLLIRAAYVLKYKKKYNNFQILIVGTGDQEKNLKSLAEKLKVDNYIKFIGFVENTKIHQYYAKADIFCSPTRFEPYGVTLIEAMAAGLPVVASDVNSIKEILGNGGLTFEKDVVEELVKLIEFLINNPKKRHQIGRFSRQRALNDFSWRNIVKSYISYI